MRLLSEYLAKFYPRGHYQIQVRLGRAHKRDGGKFVDQAEERMLGLFRRWADAIVFLETEVILIEAAIKPDVSDVAKLDLYESLFPSTPELAHVANLPVFKQIVTAIEDPAVTAYARNHGVAVTIFKPPWIDNYLESIRPRERSAFRS